MGATARRSPTRPGSATTRSVASTSESTTARSRSVGPSASRTSSSPAVVSARVVTAAQSAAADRRSIDAGIPSRALMQRAGAAAATEIARRFPRRLRRGVAVYAGPGNNGGDGWVVAGALSAAGIPVRVLQVGELRTDDARAERDQVIRSLPSDAPHGGEEVVVD